MSICQFMVALVRGHTYIRTHWKQQKEVKMNMCVCAGGGVVCVPTYKCDLGVRCSQPLMTFACCCCEQSDPAVLIKTNGTDHSPLIVFH